MTAGSPCPPPCARSSAWSLATSSTSSSATTPSSCARGARMALSSSKPLSSRSLPPSRPPCSTARAYRRPRREIRETADSRAKRNGLSEADLDVPAKLLEQRLEGRQEAEALPRRQVVAEHDLLQLGVAQRVEVEVAR